jgi:hypothetical protein
MVSALRRPPGLPGVRGGTRHRAGTGPVSGHPDWCVRTYCTSTGHSGAHRSAPVAVDTSVSVTANLYSPSAGVTLVEVHCGQTLLPPDAAYGLGRLLVSLGKAAGGNPS